MRDIINWQPPDPDDAELQHRYGNNVLLEFVRSHSPSAILRELAQNEYDAGGNTLEIRFGEAALEVTGNGKPIDRSGWNRLSVTLGTGTIPGPRSDVQRKTNGIGSKNFGLRSLFAFGDKIYVRSNGQQTLLDIERGTLEKPRPEPTTANKPGVRIYVPYRTELFDVLKPFTSHAEGEFLDDFSNHISLILLKLAHHGKQKGLQRVVVNSERHGRRIVWRQNVKKLPVSAKGISLFRRRITMTDSQTLGKVTEEEYEWQNRFELPEKFSREHIPRYFRDRSSHVKVGVSLPTRRGKVRAREGRGIAYYPIGVEHAHTGNGISISAPFEMNPDRSELIDPSNSTLNRWLLDCAADMTTELLKADWFDRFGPFVYQMAGDISGSTLKIYSDSVTENLKNEPCWPSRGKTKSRRRSILYAPAHNLVMASSPPLDQFLGEEHYLHPAISDNSMVRKVAARYGVEKFTVNSLIRLRCAGLESDNLKSRCKEWEANCYDTNFPKSWEDISRQKRCAEALNKHRRELSGENRADIEAARTTLTAAGSLASAKDVWFVPKEIRECPVLEKHRLHPELTQYLVLRNLCEPFDVAKWMERVIKRLEAGEASGPERLSLYEYLKSVSGRVPGKLRKTIKNSPVLKDRDGNWVSPKLITVHNAAGVSRFRPALYLPHRDFAKNETLAKALGFKTKITGDDVVRFAERVSAQPELAEDFERILTTRPRLLTPHTVRRLAAIEFIRSNDGELRSPLNLHLDIPKNRACIGPAGPYPVGNQKKLYAKLGCRQLPDQERIVAYLAALRQNGEPPPRPDILYSELVAALKRDSAPDALKEEAVLCTGNGYSAPADTIMVGRWTKVFLDTVPTIKTSSPKLKQACWELGARKEPEERHWKRFFMSIGETYRNRGFLAPNERSAMRNAYSRCKELPSLPSDLPWLLDESGRLHKRLDVEKGRILIDDEPRLAKVLREIDPAPVSFTDHSEPDMERFFRQQGVKFLSSNRRKVREDIGKCIFAPRWFSEEKFLHRLTNVNFGFALTAITVRDFPHVLDVEIQVKGTVKKLRSLRSITFSDSMFAEYRIGRISAKVPAEHVWADCNIRLLRVRSKVELQGRLASLVAMECFPSGSEIHRRLADSIFRLIACEDTEDIRAYLRQRGIPWPSDAENRNNDVECNQREADEYDIESEMPGVEDIVHRAFRDGRISATNVTMGRQSEEFRNMGEKRVEITEEAISLPPIKEIKARIVDSRNDWTYSRKPSEGRSGSGGGWSPNRQSEERDRAVGRHGEEIVFSLEKERVRKAGLPVERVVWVSEYNPGSEFDIASVDDDGEELFIEVKSTAGSDGKFHWSISEFQCALRERKRYILYRVYRATDPSPVVRRFPNPVSLMSRGLLHLDIESFRAEVEPDS